MEMVTGSGGLRCVELSGLRHRQVTASEIQKDGPHSVRTGRSGLLDKEARVAG